MKNTTENVPEWIEKLAVDILEQVEGYGSSSVLAQMIADRVAQHPPMIPEVPWKVLSHVDMPSRDGKDIRIIGFKCEMPEYASLMTFEKMEWLRAMRFGLNGDKYGNTPSG